MAEYAFKMKNCADDKRLIYKKDACSAGRGGQQQ